MKKELIKDVEFISTALINGKERCVSNPRLITYTIQYNAILKFLEATKTLQEGRGVAVAMMAYGWMPTVLQKIEIGQLNKLHRQANEIDLSHGIDTVLLAHRLLETCQADAVVNRSWIGTSKFLHFLQPTLFPIWDTNICVVLGGPKSHDRVKIKERYIEYFELVHGLLSEPKIEQIINGLQSEANSWSPIRKFEFLLFASNFEDDIEETR